MQIDFDFKKYCLDRESPVPLHVQLCNMITDHLRSLSPDREYHLPSERTVARELKINRLTVHRAYTKIMESGLVNRNLDKSLSVAPGARRKLRGDFPVIGVVLPTRFSIYVDMCYQRPLNYLKGVIDEAEKSGVSIVMLQLPPRDASAELVEQFISERCANLSGLVHFGNRGNNEDDPPLYRLLEYTGIPQVFVSCFSRLPHIASIIGDPSRGAQELSLRLKELNCRTAGIVKQHNIFDIPESMPFVYASFNRSEVIAREFEAVGIEVSAEIMITSSSMERAVAAIDELLRKHLLPDVFWCDNDITAKTLITMLEKRNIRVPEDISVVGFDSWMPSGDSLRPASIRQPAYQIGAAAVKSLLHQFEFGLSPDRMIEYIPTEFVPGYTLRTTPFH